MQNRLISIPGGESVIHTEHREASYEIYHPTVEPGWKVWECSVCGTCSRWSDGWQWFGSLLDLEEGNDITVVCSDDCRWKHDAED